MEIHKPDGSLDDKSVDLARRQGGTSLIPTSSPAMWRPHGTFGGVTGGGDGSLLHASSGPLQVLLLQNRPPTLCLGQPQASLPWPNQPSPHTAICPWATWGRDSVIQSSQTSRVPQQPGLFFYGGSVAPVAAEEGPSLWKGSPPQHCSRYLALPSSCPGCLWTTRR